MAKKFFSRLSYSIGNEDWETERDALKIKSDDTILCITASGDRPLNLLMNDCKKIVSIDANPIQNHLLELKMAAIQELKYEDNLDSTENGGYLGFLGVKEQKNRTFILKRLLPLLSKSAKEYWLTHQKMIAKGVLYQGAVERLTTIVSKVFRLLRPNTIKKLFAIEDLEEQREFVQKYWDRRWWRKIFEFSLNPTISSIVIEDPGLMNIGAKIKPGIYIYDRIIHSLNHCLANENLLLSLIFQGRILPGAYTPYLTKFGIQTIKSRLNRLTIQTNEIVEYLESFSGPTFDCFSLSDIASYMDHAHFVRLLKAICKTAKPGARFCIRQFLSSQQIPEEMEMFFKRDEKLEKQLEERERCFIYRFTVGTVVKSVEKDEAQTPLIEALCNI